MTREMIEGAFGISAKESVCSSDVGDGNEMGEWVTWSYCAGLLIIGGDDGDVGFVRVGILQSEISYQRFDGSAFDSWNRQILRYNQAEFQHKYGSPYRNGLGQSYPMPEVCELASTVVPTKPRPMQSSSFSRRIV